MNEKLPAATSGPNPASLPANDVEIRVENLNKSFGTRHVLHDINLEVRRGEMVAIVGGSGGGKTTLLRHLTGHFHPDQGRVLIADHEAEGSPLVDLAELDPAGMERLQRHWAVVFQGNGLISGNVYDNIALALREVQGMDEASIGKKVREVIGAVELDVERDPQLNVEQLSGGMAKRVAIARALALEPILIFYDEATTGLDPLLAEHIQDLIFSVHQRKPESGMARTSLLITHDKDLLYRLRPRTIMLDAGHILFDGSYEDFAKSDSPVIRPYFELMPLLNQRLVPSLPPLAR